MLTVLLWVVVGVFAGLIGRAVAPNIDGDHGSRLGTVLLTVLGAVIAGLIHHLMTGAGPSVSAFDLTSVGWSAVGAAAVAMIAWFVQKHAS